MYRFLGRGTCIFWLCGFKRSFRSPRDTAYGLRFFEHFTGVLSHLFSMPTGNDQHAVAVRYDHVAGHHEGSTDDYRPVDRLDLVAAWPYTAAASQ